MTISSDATTDASETDGTDQNGQKQPQMPVSIWRVEQLSNSASPSRTIAANTALANFVFMSILFSSNHGAVVACLGLATARLGSVGAWLNGVLYLTYTGSALLGATYVVKQLGPRSAMMSGMGLYGVYVGAFWVATRYQAWKTPAALLGAALGGMGGGFLWTAQGAYFAKSAEQYAAAFTMTDRLAPSGHHGTNTTVSQANAHFAAIFAFIYLFLELMMRSLSSVLIQVYNLAWSKIFAIYAVMAVLSTGLMTLVYSFPPDEEQTTSSSSLDVWYKVTAGWRLLRQDPKIRWFIGLNAVFGLSSAFLNSYINGQVVRVVLHDDQSKYIGLLTAWSSGVAAVMSLVFGHVVTPRVGKGPILMLGSLCFMMVALPLILYPQIEHWSWLPLVLIYTMQGTGRSTFEGTLKATFADYFPYEKEGAFANIILQNGLSSAFGFVLTFRLKCNPQSTYCVQYQDGSLHNVLIFEMLIVMTAVLAILGYWRASVLHAAVISYQQVEDQAAEVEEYQSAT